MSKQNRVLHLRIEQQGDIRHHYVRGKSTFTIGRDDRNNLRLQGNGFPGKHALFIAQDGQFLMQIPPGTQGEISTKNSSLRLSDLIDHELLPTRNGVYLLPVKPGKMGYVFFGTTRIDFVIEQNAPQVQQEPIEFYGFNKRRLFWIRLKEDALFKGLVTGMILFNSSVLYTLKDYVPPPKPKQSAEDVVRRISRFIIEPPKVENTPIVNDIKPIDQEDEKEPEDNKPERAKKPERTKQQNTPPTQKRAAPAGGLMALIGSSSTNKTGSVAEKLLSNNLAAQLSTVSGSQGLTIGAKRNDDLLNNDDIFGALASGGIEDLLGDPNGVETSVTLTKRPLVKLDRVESVKGSAEARGARSEGSLLDVIQANMGRLRFIYNRYLKRDPNFSGLMRVEVVIGPDGGVKTASVLSSNFGNSAFEQEIINAIKRFKYNSISQGEVTIVYPIGFTRQS
ncbi:MAG: TonB family protein [Deferribacteres bacterium]|nr:TonB family protein [candidate division KSB1 bacterium]MCB9503983.1 TonB family protein [Deferribacteres bacterium]